MRLLICAGGTGGGVFPALAVQNALAFRLPEAETLWVGGIGGMEAEIIQRTGISFSEIPAAGLHGVGIRALPGNLMKMVQGIFASGKILRNFRPDVLFFTGGYLAVPMAIAGLTIPKILFLPAP